MSKNTRPFGEYLGALGTYAAGGRFSVSAAQTLRSGGAWDPDLISSGLVLKLDANNTSSYPGTGSSWTDLASGIQFYSSGTQTPYQTLGSSKGFAFNGSGYWQSVANDALVDMGGDTTLIMWLYNASQSTRRTIFEKAGTVYQSYQQEIACTWETPNYISYYSRYSPAYDYSDPGAAAALGSGWTMWAIKMSSGKTSTPRTGFFSINGAAWTSNYVSNSNTALVPAGAIRIGSGYAGTVGSGGVGFVAVYNRMLSDAEIAKNYATTRSKFGV